MSGRQPQPLPSPTRSSLQPRSGILARNAAVDRVSICIPVCNSKRFIGRAVESALAQDYPNIEVVVSDDASDDDTVGYLNRRFGDRLRIVENRRRRGQAGNTNVSIAQSTGSLIKFLHHDDQLDPNCVSRMADALTVHRSAGMVFSRRRIEVDADTSASREWLDLYRNLHAQFRSLQRLNSGRALMEELLENGLPNWIGEPVCVMVRRSCLERVGGFHLRVAQLVDLEMWLRVMARHDVVFIDEELVTYRHAADSLTGRVLSQKLNWLDRLWMLDTLAADPELRSQIPAIEPRWRFELKGARRALLGWRPQGNDPPIGPWVHYMAHRALRRFGLSRVVGKV